MDYGAKTERNKKIYQMRQDGATFSEIGKVYGLSLERVRQIYLREERRFRYLKYKKRNGTRLIISDIEYEIHRLRKLSGDKTYSGGEYHKERLSRERKEMIEERISFLEAYKEIIDG